MDREGEKCVGTGAHGEIVGHCEDVDAMGESSLKEIFMFKKKAFAQVEDLLPVSPHSLEMQQRQLFCN